MTTRKPVGIGQSHALMAAVAANVAWEELDSETVQWFVNDPKGTGRLITQLLRGELVVQEKSGLPAPRDALWQTPKQAAGGSCTLRELLAAAPEGETRTIDWYLEDTSRIPEEWRGRVVFFRNSEFRGGDGGRYVLYLYWGGGRWDRSYRWVGGPVNGHGFLAVPASAL